MFLEEEPGIREELLRLDERIREEPASNSDCTASDVPSEAVPSELVSAADAAAEELSEPESARETGGGTEDKVGHSAVVHAVSRKKRARKTGHIFFLLIS